MNRPRILVAPNAYKETFDARAVAGAMADGVRAVDAVPVVMPLSDGGDGLLDALDASGVLRRYESRAVTGPLGDATSVPFGWLDDETAVVESRLIVGLSLVPPERRNPCQTTTVGLGELLNVIAPIATTVFVGLGGSATMDGGVDMARAWGWKPLDATGKTTALGGGGLLDIRSMEPGMPPAAKIVGLADVENPLLGPAGAAVYGSQKGATPGTLELLTRGLDNLISVLGGDAAHIAQRPGSGAAGGLGFGLRYFANGELISGASWILERLDFAGHLSRVSAVITGEGAFDATSMVGKTPGLVIRHAQEAKVPVAVVAPTVADVPEAIHVETGEGRWSLDDIREAASRAVRHMISLPGP